MTEHDEDLILRTPVAVSVATPRLVLLTRVFSWIAVSLLLGAMVISLVLAGQDRDRLKNQIADQSRELVCRAQADDGLIIATAQRDEVIAEALAAVAQGDDLTLQLLVGELEDLNVIVDREVSEMALALEQCDRH